MPSEVILYGPDSTVYDTYAQASPAPDGGPGVSGTPIAGVDITPAFRNVRPLGTQLVLADGRKFRFARAGANTLVTGSVQQSPVVITTDQAMTPLTGTPNYGGTIGDKSVSFTHGAATTVVNYFAEGFLVVAVTNFDTYKVARHLALVSAVAGDQVFLWPGHSIRNNVLTASTTVSLYSNPYNMVIQMAATITGVPVGIAMVPATTLRGTWLLTRGPCGVLASASILAGSPGVMLLTGGTAGSVAPASAATQPQVGNIIALDATPATKAAYLMVTLDG